LCLLFNLSRHRGDLVAASKTRKKMIKEEREVKSDEELGSEVEVSPKRRNVETDNSAEHPTKKDSGKPVRKQPANKPKMKPFFRALDDLLKSSVKPLEMN